jgi:hypothetical protein
MATIVTLNANCIHRLDLSPVQSVVNQWFAEGAIARPPQTLQFVIDYPRDPIDPRELSEIPEIRLWFIRLDACYPWLPFVLDWESGELARYAAMLVPHQFSPTDGIQYNPEALEIFVMQKIFGITAWLHEQGIEGQNRLKMMTKMLGYELDDGLFALLGNAN